MKHKVRMLSSQMGVPDGEIHPVPFNEGEEYEVGPDLLDGFINLGAVELADVDGTYGKVIQPRKLAEGEMLEEGDLPEGTTAVQVKSEGDAPENKAVIAAPENKKRKK